MSDLNYQRNTTQSGNRKEIESIIRRIQNGDAEYTIRQDLLKHKKEDVVDALMNETRDRLEKIKIKARKFKQVIYDKYAPQNLTFQQLLKKAKKYQKKFKLSDSEFQMFVNLSLTDKTYSDSFPTTPMAKTLGISTHAAFHTQSKLNVKNEEISIVNEIIKLYGQTKPLHAQIVRQCLAYRDCAPEALHGSADFRQHRQNIYSYVHPVIAALFLIKVDYLDEHMLMANLGYIVKCKMENKPINTKPDYELYWDLITDPNETVCHTSTPIKDLYNRFVLQTKLWDAVLNLRQGRYYNDKLVDFLSAIENCRNNIYDSPDLTYIRDEGTILRRLLAAFAIRPTIVSTSRMFGMFNVGAAGGYGVNVDPLAQAGITDVTTVPMITYRLPVNINNQPTDLHLNDSLSQPQWYVENNMIVPKSQNIIHSRDVLFFYVNRRFQQIHLSKYSSPYNFTSLPMTVSGWETMNDAPINFDKYMQIYNETYILRSVVAIEHSQQNNNLIVGSSALVYIPRGSDLTGLNETAIRYDPQGALEMFVHDNEYVNNNPITRIDVGPSYGTDDDFTSMASTRGCVFIYVKDKFSGQHASAPYINFY